MDLCCPTQDQLATCGYRALKMGLSKLRCAACLNHTPDSKELVQKRVKYLNAFYIDYIVKMTIFWIQVKQIIKIDFT